MLIVWDRLFGSFVAEDAAVPCEFGIVGPIHSHNPLTLTFHEWRDLWRDAARAHGWRARLGQLFGPPERAMSHPLNDPRRAAPVPPAAA